MGRSWGKIRPFTKLLCLHEKLLPPTISPSSFVCRRCCMTETRILLWSKLTEVFWFVVRTENCLLIDARISVQHVAVSTCCDPSYLQSTAWRCKWEGQDSWQVFFSKQPLIFPTKTHVLNRIFILTSSGRLRAMAGRAVMGCTAKTPACIVLRELNILLNVKKREMH